MNRSKPQRKLSVLEKVSILKNMQAALQLPSPHGVSNKAQAKLKAQASNEDSQKKKDGGGGMDEFKSELGKIFENRGGANDNTHEDSGDEEEVSSMSSFGNDEV